MFSSGGRLGSIKWPECDFCDHAVSLQCSQKCFQGMAGHDFLGAYRAHEEQSRTLVEAQQIMEPFQSLVVAPLQVIKQEQQGLAGIQYSASKRFKEMPALPSLGHSSGTSEFRPCSKYLWYQPCNLSEPGRVKGW